MVAYPHYKCATVKHLNDIEPSSAASFSSSAIVCHIVAPGRPLTLVSLCAVFVYACWPRFCSHYARCQLCVSMLTSDDQRRTRCGVISNGTCACTAPGCAMLTSLHGTTICTVMEIMHTANVFLIISCGAFNDIASSMCVHIFATQFISRNLLHLFVLVAELSQHRRYYFRHQTPHDRRPSGSQNYRK